MELFGINIGSTMAALMLGWTMFQQFFPYHLSRLLELYTLKMAAFFYPYIQITFPEFTGDRLTRSEAYVTIQNYLAAISSATARRLKVDFVKENNDSVLLAMDDYEEVTDVFHGVKVKWSSTKTVRPSQSVSFYPAADERRSFALTVHSRHRELVTSGYIAHVLKEGKAIASRNRQRKLYTNNSSSEWSMCNATKWSHVAFDHPASFDTLAMATGLKEGIKKDLVKFSQGKDYYNRIGKPWKRGYLLYGPPGTGKSTMIVAMANFLNYDIYDLELTTVRDNSELRKLLIETTSKSVIVIEDIDCSLDLTGQRKKGTNGEKSKQEDEANAEEKDPLARIRKGMGMTGMRESKVTLSGLLNFIDGIWSACGGERIIVFSTNYIDSLDPALIRRGRMDMHIEMSYCCFQAFKLLARNYLNLESHELFGEIEVLLEETKMTPADVAEKLMLKSDDKGAESCLRNLIEALEVAKLEEEAAKLKAMKSDLEQMVAKLEEAVKLEEATAKLKAMKSEENVAKLESKLQVKEEEMGEDGEKCAAAPRQHHDRKGSRTVALVAFLDS